MARKASLRLAASGKEPGEAANDAPTAVAANIAQGEFGLAAAALLPLLDQAARGGDGPSGLAAALIRARATRDGEAVAPLTPAGAQMAAATARLAQLAREQEAHIARLEAMLETLL